MVVVFTVLSVWGDLISFRSVLVFSSAFFPEESSAWVPLCFLQPFFSVFSRKNRKHFAVVLPCCPIGVCWPVRFQFFQYALQASYMYVLQPVAGLAFDAFYRRSFIFRGFSGRFSSCFGPLVFAFKRVCSCSAPHVFRQSASLVSLLVLCAENLTARFPAGLFPQFHCCFSNIVSHYISSSALEATSSLSSVTVAGTLRLLPFRDYLHTWPSCFDSPSLLLSLLFVQRTSPPVPQRGSSHVSSIVSRFISSSALDATSSLSSVAGTLRLLPFYVYLHLWPSRFDSPSLLSSLQCGSFPCIQRCFSSVVSRVTSSSALDATSLLSSVAGTLRLLPFCVYLHRCFCHPRLLLGLPGSVDGGFIYGVACLFQRFFTCCKFGPRCVTRRLCLE